MKISIITLFPEVFDPILNTSILKRAQQKGKVEFELINLRPFGEGKHQVVDDRPYGGGAGMILRADILAKALKYIVSSIEYSGKNKKQQSLYTEYSIPYTILMSASGIPFKQSKAWELSKLEHLVIICGHYEGIDQRFADKYVDEEISIGDYVLTGGEIAAMAIVDSIVRLIKGVLKKPEAIENESFSNYTLTPKPYTLLEYPQYTRPEEFEGIKVPKVLLSGNHAEIAKWRQAKSLKKTKRIRPDLLDHDKGLDRKFNLK